MSSRDRQLAVLALLLLIVGLKVGQQLYRWFAYGDERAAIESLQDDLTEAGVTVVRTSVTADSLKAAIEEADQSLERTRSELARREARMSRGAVTASAASAYRADFESYNDRVGERNELFREWQAVVQENHRGVDRYNEAADSIRVLGERMGEPYFPIPSPAEIVARLGDSTAVQDTAR